jgi:DNA-binding NarL/FixJ family response regulator
VAYTVLIVEDDPATRRRLEAIVRAAPNLELVASVGSAEEARAPLGAEPDVMLVDLGLPDGSGVDLIRAVRRAGSRTRAMVITVFADERHVLDAIKAGAQGYILKDGSADYVGRSIDDLIAGGSPISAPIARHLLLSLQQSSLPPAEEKGAPLLTERELEILTLVARGFSAAEVGEMLGISHRTVTTHVQNIYRKLEVSSRSQAIYEAVNLGLIDLKR